MTKILTQLYCVLRPNLVASDRTVRPPLRAARTAAEKSGKSRGQHREWAREIRRTRSRRFAVPTTAQVTPPSQVSVSQSVFAVRCRTRPQRLSLTQSVKHRWLSTRSPRRRKCQQWQQWYTRATGRQCGGAIARARFYPFESGTCDAGEGVWWQVTDGRETEWRQTTTATPPSLIRKSSHDRRLCCVQRLYNTERLSAPRK